MEHIEDVESNHRKIHFTSPRGTDTTNSNTLFSNHRMSPMQDLIWPLRHHRWSKRTCRFAWRTPTHCPTSEDIRLSVDADPESIRTWANLSHRLYQSIMHRFIPARW